MAWYDYIDMGSPPVFNPKVTPDPIDAERLDEKLRQAKHKLNPHQPQSVTSVLSLMASSAKRID